MFGLPHSGYLQNRDSGGLPICGLCAPESDVENVLMLFLCVCVCPLFLDKEVEPWCFVFSPD